MIKAKFSKTNYNVKNALRDHVAEWSKAPASGAGPQGRGFESPNYQLFNFLTLNNHTIKLN